MRAAPQHESRGRKAEVGPCNGKTARRAERLSAQTPPRGASVAASRSTVGGSYPMGDGVMPSRNAGRLLLGCDPSGSLGALERSPILLRRLRVRPDKRRAGAVGLPCVKERKGFAHQVRGVKARRLTQAPARNSPPAPDGTPDARSSR